MAFNARQSIEKRQGIIAANNLPEPKPDCLPCTSGLTPKGYGKEFVDGKCQQSHRLAYARAHGLPIEALANLEIMHSCDYRPCINPDHLSAGTHAENMRAMADRNRSGKRSGESNGNSILTSDQVAHIRKNFSGKYGERSILARKYGVTAANIGHILARRLWKEND